MNIYVASSRKNELHPSVVKAIRALGHQVYDFKCDGFGWEDIDPCWEQWSLDNYLDALNHEKAIQGFVRNFCAMKCADAFVLVLSSGRSAHLEAGWAIGQKKPTCILLSEETFEAETFEAELMYKLADYIARDMDSLEEWLNTLN